VGCVAWHFNWANHDGYDNDCDIYFSVTGTSSRYPTSISGYRKQFVPGDFKPSKGITVDNTTGIAATVHGDANENWDALCTQAATQKCSDTETGTSKQTSGSSSQNCLYIPGLALTDASQPPSFNLTMASAPEECCNLCVTSKGCQAFTWQPTAHDSEAGSCRLISSRKWEAAAQNESSHEVVSGIPLQE
jgi:hypothetical protein